MSKLTVNNRYATTPNHILNDPNLSLKAKWLRWYIQSKPDWWEFSVKRIAYQTKDGEKAVRAWIKELEEYWYLVRNAVRKPNWDFWWYNYTLTENASLQKGTTPNASTPNGITLSKKEYSKKETVKKKQNNGDGKKIDFETIRQRYYQLSKLNSCSAGNKQQAKKEFAKVKRTITQEELLRRIDWYFAEATSVEQKTQHMRTRLYQEWYENEYEPIANKSYMDIFSEFDKERSQYDNIEDRRKVFQKYVEKYWQSTMDKVNEEVRKKLEADPTFSQ